MFLCNVCVCVCGDNFVCDLLCAFDTSLYVVVAYTVSLDIGQIVGGWEHEKSTFNPLTTEDHFSGSSSKRRYLVNFIVALRFLYRSIAYLNCITHVSILY